MSVVLLQQRTARAALSNFELKLTYAITIFIFDMPEYLCFYVVYSLIINFFFKFRFETCSVIQFVIPLLSCVSCGINCAFKETTRLKKSRIHRL